MSEKLTGADHTKLDDQFTQMEKITDVFLEVEVGDNIRPSVIVTKYSNELTIIYLTSLKPKASLPLILYFVRRRCTRKPVIFCIRTPRCESSKSPTRE